LRYFLNEEKREKLDFLLFSMRNSEDSSFKMLEFGQFIQLFKDDSKKNDLFLIFIDSFNQQTAANALLKLVFFELSKFLQGNEVLQFILIKDFFYYNPNKCIEFNNSLYWKLILPVNFHKNCDKKKLQ